MKEAAEIFQQVIASIKARPWFAKGEWNASIHPFPEKDPEALTLHVFKEHWLNADTRGIHIESFLHLDPGKRKKSSVHLHLLHDDLIPGTNLKRHALSKPVVNAIYDEVSRWKGYKFRAGRYGMQPFTKELDGNSAKFVAQLSEELELLCRHVGPAIDRALRALPK